MKKKRNNNKNTKSLKSKNKKSKDFFKFLNYKMVPIMTIIVAIIGILTFSIEIYPIINKFYSDLISKISFKGCTSSDSQKILLNIHSCDKQADEIESLINVGKYSVAKPKLTKLESTYPKCPRVFFLKALFFYSQNVRSKINKEQIDIMVNFLTKAIDYGTKPCIIVQLWFFMA